MLFEKRRLTITHEPLLEIHGRPQHVEGVASVLAQDVRGRWLVSCFHTKAEREVRVRSLAKGWCGFVLIERANVSEGA